MNKKELKEQEEYGFILVEFANAESNEDAFKALLEGMKRVKKIPKKIRNDENSLRTSKDVNTNQKKIRKILDEIIENESLKNNEDVTKFFKLYRSKCLPLYSISDENVLKKNTALKSFKVISEDVLIAYNLFKFLKNKKNKEYLNKCTKCSKFFISKKTGVLKCKICSKKSTLPKEDMKKYQADYRIKKSNVKTIKKIEDKYKHLRDQGWNDEETLNWLRDQKKFTDELIKEAVPQFAELVSKLPRQNVNE